MNTNFIIKEKTEFYKEFMQNLEYAESDSFATKETVIFQTQTSEIRAVFKMCLMDIIIQNAVTLYFCIQLKSWTVILQ
jgi:hypothetical protein